MCPEAPRRWAVNLTRCCGSQGLRSSQARTHTESIYQQGPLALPPAACCSLWALGICQSSEGGTRRGGLWVGELPGASRAQDQGEVHIWGCSLL